MPGFRSEPFVQWMNVPSFDGNFFKHLKSNAIVLLAKRGNFTIGARLLPHEIVSWKSKNNYFIGELLVKFLKIFVLIGVTTFGCGVHYQKCFVFKLFKIDGLPFEAGERKLIN